MHTKQQLTGAALVAVSAAGFGTLGLLGRYAYADGMDALTILSLRFTLSAVALVLLLAVRHERLPSGRTLLKLIGMGAVGYVGQGFAYMTAVRYASPGLVALLLYLYPAFVLMLSAVWLHERVTRLRVLALIVALAGLALTVSPAGGQLLGTIFAISAALIYSVYILVGTQVMKQVSAVQSSAVIFASAAVMSGILMAINGPHLPASAAGYGAIGLMVLLATVIPVVSFLAGLERVGATNASMLSTLEPVVTVLLTALLLGETLQPVTLLGGGLILLAVLLLAGGTLRQTRRARSGATLHDPARNPAQTEAT